MKTAKGFEFLLKYGGVIVFLIYGFSRSLRGIQGHEKILFSNFDFKFRSHGNLIKNNFHEKFQKFPKKLYSKYAAFNMYPYFRKKYAEDTC